MHTVFSWRIWLTLAFALLVGIAAFQFAVLDKDVFEALTSSIGPASLAALAFVATPLWRVIWLIPFISKKAPILDGRWNGIQQSNWPVILAMKEAAKGSSEQINVDDAGQPLPDLSATEIDVEITSSFFHVRLKTETKTTRYMRGNLVTGEIAPATDREDAKFHYVFEGIVDDPVPTDSSRFDGAAKLTITRSPAGVLEMMGPMWTNRTWRKGLNTAGNFGCVRTEDWTWRPILFWKKYS